MGGSQHIAYCIVCTDICNHKKTRNHILYSIGNSLSSSPIRTGRDLDLPARTPREELHQFLIGLYGDVHGDVHPCTRTRRNVSSLSLLKAIRDESAAAPPSSRRSTHQSPAPARVSSAATFYSSATKAAYREAETQSLQVITCRIFGETAQPT